MSNEAHGLFAKYTALNMQDQVGLRVEPLLRAGSFRGVVFRAALCLRLGPGLSVRSGQATRGAACIIITSFCVEAWVGGAIYQLST
jgi:hypothetical protein